MKRMLKLFCFVMAALLVCLCLGACNKTTEDRSLWESAVYTEDTELGNGEKTVLVEVEVQDRSVTFTVRTDRKTLGEALVDNKLIQGENGAYGLYVKVVNGITADYDVNQSYWALCKNGESVQTGVDGVEISDGEHYELIYTKN